jgi:phage gp46-like protein
MVRAMVDIALTYDPVRRGCDVVFNGTDFALDATPASAMLMSVCADRRAKPDDALPSPVDDWAHPNSFTARRGYPGDALDPAGGKVGSRMWLLQRRLEDEQTRTDAENYLLEACSWLESVRNLAVQITVRWIAPQFLGYRVRAGKTVLQLTRAID